MTALDHLDWLEAESIKILREVLAEGEFIEVCVDITCWRWARSPGNEEAHPRCSHMRQIESRLPELVGGGGRDTAGVQRQLRVLGRLIGRVCK